MTSSPAQWVEAIPADPHGWGLSALKVPALNLISHEARSLLFFPLSSSLSHTALSFLLGTVSPLASGRIVGSSMG